MQEPYTLEQLKARLIPIFEQNHVRKATLFGSYGKGLATAESDVDIYVDSGLCGLRFFGLLEDIRASVACEVDLIDKEDIIPDSRIEEEIRKTGIVLYEC